MDDVGSVHASHPQKYSFFLAVRLAVFVSPFLRASRLTDGHAEMRLAFVFDWSMDFVFQLISSAVTFAIVQPIV